MLLSYLVYTTMIIQSLFPCKKEKDKKSYLPISHFKAYWCGLWECLDKQAKLLYILNLSASIFQKKPCHCLQFQCEPLA